VVLVCEGLDTIAEVFINDQSVGKSENMFARYIFDVKGALTVILANHNHNLLHIDIIAELFLAGRSKYYSRSI